MKTKLLFTLITCYTFFLQAQTYVPDDNFEQALINLGYDSGALDDYVPTANINAITSLNVQLKGINDLTGIEDFTALQTLSCGINNLSTLDISSNVNLTYLSCFANDLTNLDLSQNIGLTYLNCGANLLTNLNTDLNINLEELICFDNPITNLDVSQLSNLTFLSCGETSLSTIDLSQNSMLSSLICSYSPQLVSLDVSMNAALTELRCQGNSTLTSLNVKNGNNTAITLFYANQNPNLTCIEVDNAAYSTTNWTAIDATTSFSENCATMSINDETISQIKLFPNPSSDYLNIKSKNIVNQDYQIMDILGKPIGSGTMISNKINISLLKSGIYFLRLSDEKFSKTFKIIKQ